LVEKESIIFTRAKDAMAARLKRQEIPNEPRSLKEVEERLLTRADEYYETHKERKIEDFSREGIQGDIDDIHSQIKKDIKQILQEDTEAYGETSATRLNFLLSLAHPLPLANIFYGRDQSQALASKLVLSAVKWEIRKPEVAVFKEALIELGYKDSLVELDRGTFEGGDVAMFGDTCFIGIGARTSMSAVKNLTRKIGPFLEREKVQIIGVVNQRHEDEADLHGSPTDEHMKLMHLDMFWIPLEPHLALAYGDEIDRRKIVRISYGAGGFVTEELGSFRQFHANKAIEVIEVSRQEQENFATNLLNLGNKTVIVALSTNKRVIKELENRGYLVLSAELNKLVSGYGATHCLTAPIRRTITR